MRHSKFQDHSTLGSRDKEFLKVLPYMGEAAIIFYQLMPPTPPPPPKKKKSLKGFDFRHFSSHFRLLTLDVVVVFLPGRNHCSFT